MFSLRAVLVLAPLALVACEQPQPVTSYSTLDIPGLKADLKAVEERVGKLETEAQAVNEVVSNRRTFPPAAIFSPGEDGFASVMFEFGVLLVGLKDVKPYASGTKVTLAIGNPTSASLGGLKMKVEWAPKRKEGGGYDFANKKSKDVTFPQKFTAGSFTRVEVALDDISPERFGWVSVSNLEYTTFMLAAAKP